MTIPPPKGPAAGRCAAHAEEAVIPNRLTVRQAGSACRWIAMSPPELALFWRLAKQL